MTMADEEHLKILKQGVEVWNRWRKENPDVRPSLRSAHLSRAKLSGAHLRRTDLREATLREANLSGADLVGADLIKADLHGAYLVAADLSTATLCQAHLNAADLSEADLRGANLSRADLREADLIKADLNAANLSRTHLSGVDLRHADLGGADLRHADLIRADLGEANLRRADLRGADLSEADLSEADLSEADLNAADLSGANLREATLREATLREANLSGADLRRANLSGSDLSGMDLSSMDFSEVNLSGAILNQTMLVGTDLSHANLSNCSVYGIAAWNLNLEGAIQSNLVITPPSEPIITVDNLQVAQFIYLLLNNQEIRHIIDTITSKVVLILGRFKPERKAVLDALREELRRRDYLPILFDFEKPSSRDLTETISTLAHMARFVIADITDAKSIPQELQAIVPDLPSVPVQPLIASSDYEYGMFEHFRRYPWVLETYQYDRPDDLLGDLGEKVISPAERKAKELTGKK
jgi:uncharacterized protein YjbI with pentapeptide repeats